MERRETRNKLKLFYMAVSVFFLMLTAWLYWKEDSYIKIMRLETVPKKGRFQAEILADGRNGEVMCDDPTVNLYVEQQMVEGRLRLLIYGECKENDREEPVVLKITGDSHNREEIWKYQILMGGEAKEAELTVKPNHGRTICLLSAVLMVIVGGAAFFGLGRKPFHSEAAACTERILNMLEKEPGLEGVFAEGKRFFAVCERRKMMNFLLLGWLWLFMVFWLVHSRYRSAITGGSMALCFLAAGVMLLLVTAVGRRGNRLLIKLLTDQCRPLTAACAYLMMGNYGAGDRRDRAVWYQNAATGLFRGGYYEEALAVSKLSAGFAGKKRDVCLEFMGISLEQRCLTETGAAGEARKQKKRLNALVKANPSLEKRWDVQRSLVQDQVRQQIEEGEMEEAETAAQNLLNQCVGGYDRLPVLNLLAAVKEHLGKETEARILKNEILMFSPENVEVRHAMKEGRLSFRQTGISMRDPADAGIRFLCGVGIVCFVLLTIAPGLKTIPESYGIVEEETGVAVEPTLDAGTR